MTRIMVVLLLGRAGQVSANGFASSLSGIIEARAYAGMGSAADCYRALEAAQDTFARAGADTDPGWCSFFDKGELYGLPGVTLRDLALSRSKEAERYASEARPWIQRAVDNRPRHFLRSRVMDMDSLTVVNILLHEPESAVKTASTTLAMAERVTSSRVMNRLRRTAELGISHFPRSSAIADFGHQARSLTSGPINRRS
jgi:hypothetical protein